MEMVIRKCLLMAILALVMALVLPSINARGPAPAPAPAPSSDGSAIDQGIACLLMMLALALTYIIH